MPVWGHGGTYSTAKHGDPRASTYAGLRPMDLVSQLSFVALSRGKVMLKHTINSRHCLGGFSVCSLMQCFQFTLDFTWWSSWRLRSSPNRYDTTPGKNVLSPPHWHSRPKFLFTRTALKSIQNQNSPWVPWFIFFLHDYSDSSSQVHSKPFWNEQKIILFIELCSTSNTLCLDQT